VLGIRCVAVSEGEVSAELTPREDLENRGGTMHGALLAALLDTVMGAALHTVLSAGQKFATIDLKVNYLRPLSRASGVMRGTGRVIKAGGSLTLKARFVIQAAPWRFDMPAIERLEEALIEYPGAMVIVTHDDALARRCTAIEWRLKAGRVSVR
jgi:uncharacterized protein (TIGR00369 family)